MIYFIQSVDGGLIKIGFAHDPGKRLREIQHMSPVTLRILKVIEGDKKYEKELHRRFFDLRSHREWFRSSAELLGFIDNQPPLSYEKETKQPPPIEIINRPEMVGVKEVAEIFEIKPSTVNRWIKSGYFPGAIRRNPRAYNSTYIVPKDSVEKFKQERNATQNPNPTH